jgi:putative MFS transporter
MQARTKGSALSAASEPVVAMAGTAHHSVSSKTSVFGLLDEAPMTPVRYVYWLLASGGTLLDGFSVVSLGIAVPLLKRDLTINPVIVGLIGSALVLGAVLGAALGGVGADKLGRKRAFIADMAILVAGSAA